MEFQNITENNHSLKALRGIFHTHCVCFFKKQKIAYVEFRYG